LYTEWAPTCLGKPCGYIQGCKIQGLDALKVQNEITKSIRTNPYLCAFVGTITVKILWSFNDDLSATKES